EARDDRRLLVVAFPAPGRHLDDAPVLVPDDPALDRRPVYGQHPVGRDVAQVPTGWASARRAARRSTRTASQMEASKRIHIGSSSSAVVTGSGPGSASPITAAMK